MSRLSERKLQLIERVAANRSAVRLESELLYERASRLGRYFSWGKHAGSLAGAAFSGRSLSPRIKLIIGGLSLLSSLLATAGVLRRRRSGKDGSEDGE